MLLSELLYGVDHSELTYDVDVTGIASDSRRVGPGYVFVCLRGTKKDGNDYAAEAVARGAAAVVTDRQRNDLPFVRVPDARLAESVMWNNFTRMPARDMTVIAVTGTNGKTTVAYMLDAIFREAGFKTGLITTVRTSVGEQTVDTKGGSSVSDADAAMTTPDPEIFYPIVSRMRDAGVRVLIFEASSHALSQRKLDPLTPDVAVFTNLSEEHLDYHGTMENYFKAKARLASLSRSVVLNGDDPYMTRLASHPSATVCRVGLPRVGEPYDVCALRCEYYGLNGVKYVYFSRGAVFTVRSLVPGEFTVQNSLFAAAAAMKAGVSEKAVRDALLGFRGVEGRLQRVTPTDAPFSVFIDYAHTPAALEALLRSVRKMRKPGQKITVMFGCGGDRDRSKRKRMGAIASSYADLTVVTEDNSRGEDPAGIIKEIVSGLDREKPYAIIPDRKKAIEYCVSEAVRGQIVILAGKGHEKYEINKDGKKPFDEIKIVTDAVERRKREGTFK